MANAFAGARFVNRWPTKKEWPRIAVELAILVLLCLWKIPQWQMGNHPDLGADVVLQIENEYRRTVVQLLGGLALFAGLWLTARRIAAAEDTARAAQEQVRIAEQGQVTERFTRAIDQLGNRDNRDVWLGGLYGLERIAKDSKSDHWTVVEVLTAYLRENAAWDDDADTDPPMIAGVPMQRDVVRPDVQAVFTVLGRRTWRESEPERLDLRRTDLGAIEFRHAHLEGAILTSANLREVALPEVELSTALLSGARLERAELLGAQLDRAELAGAYFDQADLSGANLRGADCRTTHFEGAKLAGADLTDARLASTHFEGSDLSNTVGLTQTALEQCYGDKDTKLPEGLQRPLRWPSTTAPRLSRRDRKHQDLLDLLNATPETVPLEGPIEAPDSGHDSQGGDGDTV